MKRGMIGSLLFVFAVMLCTTAAIVLFSPDSEKQIVFPITMEEPEENIVIPELKKENTVEVTNIEPYEQTLRSGTRKLTILRVLFTNKENNLKSFAFLNASITYQDKIIQILDGKILDSSFPRDKCFDETDEEYKGIFTIKPNSQKALSFCFPEITENSELTITYLENAKVQKIGSKGNFFNQTIERTGTEKTVTITI